MLIRHLTDRVAPQPPSWTLRSTAAAALITVVTFLVLPCLQVLTSERGDIRRLRTIDTTRMVPPAPPPPQAMKRPEANPRRMPKPRLPLQRQPLPLRAVMNLGLSMDAAQIGDFSLDFPVAPSQLNADAESLVYELTDLDQAPQPLVQLKPAYPPRAQMRRIEGKVTVEFVVGADGKTGDIRILSAQPDDTFVAPTIRAVQRWHFKPGSKDGKPVAVRVRQTVRFEMED